MTLANGDNQWNVFPAKYSPAGELVWAQGIGGITIPLTLSSAVSVSAMAIDGADNLCLTGGFWHSAVFGTSNAVTFSSPEGTEVLYVAKFPRMEHSFGRSRARGLSRVMEMPFG